MNILFVHEIDWMRDPVFELHTLSELLSLRRHVVYAVDYRSAEGLFLRTSELDAQRAYSGARVRLTRPGFVNIPVLSRISYALGCCGAMYRILAEKKIDVVLLYSAPTNGIQTVLAAKRLGIPVVFRSIDVLHKLAPKILALPTRIAENWVYRHVDRILTITPALSRYAVSLGADPDKVRALPLGIDLDPLPDAPADTACPTMVFAGTLPLFSGLDNLLGRMPELATRIPGLRLLIVGGGKQQSRLEQMLQELGLGERVKITGMVPHEDVPKRIAGADIGILTFPASGATRDIFPTKVLQYMACGKPVVANPLPGLVDFGLGQEQGVVYVRDGDWVSAIQYALTDKEWLGKRARSYVEQEHGYDRIVSMLENELEALCRSR